MLVLDTCVGAEKIYHNWNKTLGPNFVTIDIRKGDYSYKNASSWTTHKLVVKPTVLADMKALPFKDNLFDVIVCDPPHYKCGESGFMIKWYGSWSKTDVIRTMRVANVEFSRVLKSTGSIMLKILPEQYPLYETLLKNFAFFLPIYTKRLRGSMKNPKGEKDAALWAWGVKKSSLTLD